MPPPRLDEWLDRMERSHPRRIELGLDRVGRVAAAMGMTSLPCPVVTVAGTNGKGSCVAMLESIYGAGGYRTAAYTSPHLLRYNERVRIAGREADDAGLCAAFERVERARGDVSLSYFEFGTLAALDIFGRSAPDVAILEVGLGGRLDAVNVLDADLALVTSIGLDHLDWLGSDREAIAREKAGILRAGRPAVCADPDPPRSLLEAARVLAAPLYLSGRDYEFGLDEGHSGNWTWRGPHRAREGLPPPGLAGAFQLRNAAGVLMAVDLLAGRLPMDDAAVGRGLAGARAAGRFQRIGGGPVERILDVAHNVDSAQALAATLLETPVRGATRAVFAALGDKDIDGMLSSMSPVVDAWYVAAPATGRAAPVERIVAGLRACAPAAPVCASADVPGAYELARRQARSGDRIVVFGSFYTVGEVLRAERPAQS